MVTERLKRQNERLLDEAENAVADLNWGIVRDRARAVLAFDPKNADATEFLAAAERAIGVPSSAASGATLVQVSADPPPPDVTELQQTVSSSTGRYQIKQFLGEIGNKKVYLATDTLLRRDVAFALINTEGLDEVTRTRIKREALAMARLGSHPHVVTVFQIGEHPSADSGQPSRPFIATELMGGGDLEGLIQSATDHRLPLERAIIIAQEICRGLEFAHGGGIVHRDLKPGNVWLTNDGVAKITDFGLDLAIDSSGPNNGATHIGTVSYLSPEKALGEEVTSRSDLYSLGAVLYEMVTGRPPFLGDDSSAIIAQHINTPPELPSWRNQECPRSLETLIMSLLAKDPRERPETAADVLTVLESLDLTQATAEGGHPADVHALARLSDDVFVGRQREFRELKAAFEDALSGQGRLVTLVGEPGIGKTRIAQELAGYAESRGALVLRGSCYEEQGTAPYSPWVQVISAYARDRDPEQLRTELGVGAADIVQLVSELKQVLPDLRPRPPLEDPEQARTRLFDAITGFLKTASQRQPMMLVLDDLHWADQPSLQLLQFIAKELDGSRLLLVGTYRDLEHSRQHPLAETLRELTREQILQQVLLLGLSEQNVGRLIEVVTGAPPPPRLVRAVYTQTEGNPLFVTEVVRLLAQEGGLTPERTGDQDSWNIRMSEGIIEVIGRRLNRLSQQCQQTLIVAAFIGREFSLDQLKPLMADLTMDRLVAVMEEAVDARILLEHPHAMDRYQFSHSLIQDSLVNRLTLTQGARLHAQIAEALEAQYGDNVEAHAAELARHFAKAQAVMGSEKLVHYSLLAAKRALFAYAPEEALAQFQLGLLARGVTIRRH